MPGKERVDRFGQTILGTKGKKRNRVRRKRGRKRKGGANGYGNREEGLRTYPVQG